ncbi:MAG TPA: hypothetical protein VHJ82_05190 [Actinomycetota bacterium]|nr:hypothetical protein [Actinomycetota bacterium]
MRRQLILVTTLVLLGTSLSAPAVAQDASYEQPNWFEWAETALDVIIVPPSHGQLLNGNGLLGGSEGGASEVTPFNSYLKAMEKAIADWDRAVATFGSPTLKERFATNVFVAGRDSIPTNVLLDPEIVVLWDEEKAFVLGISFSSRPCISDMSKSFISSFTYADMYNVGGHEFGHCLGLDHTLGPAGDPRIEHDIMFATYVDSPGAADNHRHCMSNLNVAGLEQSFGAALGRPGGESASVPASQYQTIGC